MEERAVIRLEGIAAVTGLLESVLSLESTICQLEIDEEDLVFNKVCKNMTLGEIKERYLQGCLGLILERSSVKMPEKRLANLLQAMVPELKFISYRNIHSMPVIPPDGSPWIVAMSYLVVDNWLRKRIEGSRSISSRSILEALERAGIASLDFFAGDQDLMVAIKSGWDIHLGKIKGWGLFHSRREILMCRISLNFAPRDRRNSADSYW